MAGLLHDLRTAVRGLRRSPAFTLIAAGSLALTIGANTVIFGVINGLLLKPLPVSHPEQLVRLGVTREGRGFGTFSYREYRTIREGVRRLSGVVAHQFNSVTVTIGAEPRTEWMELVSGNYFDVLGVRPARGRGFLPEEDRVPGGAAVVVISDGLWRRRFGAASDAVGQFIKVNGRSFTVIGVAPPTFRGAMAGFGIDLWLPVMMQAAVLPNSGSLDRPSDRFLMFLARRTPGTAIESVRQDVRDMVRRMATTDSAAYASYDISVREASGLHPFLAGLVTAFLALMQAVVGLVLLIACANLTNLFLVRLAARRRELAVRTALGASRLRVVRHVMVESLLVALLGGTVGLGLAAWFSGILSAVELPVGIPVRLDLAIDLRVVAFTFCLALGTACIAGFLPAWRASRPAVLADLRVGGATSHRTRVRGVLVGVQVAIASVLLVSTDLLIQSLRNGRTIDPGFDPGNVMLLQAEPVQLGYDSTRSRALWGDLLLRAREIPGVAGAAISTFVPLGNRGDELAMGAASGDGRLAGQPYNIVAPGYFSFLRIRLAAGREFTDTDVSGSAEVVIVSAAAGRKYFGGESPLGRQLRIEDRAGRTRLVTVVAVVGDVKYRSLGDADEALVYLPSGQWFRDDMVLHVRTATPGTALARPLTDLARSLEPDLAITLQPMSEAIGFTTIPARIAGHVLGLTGLLGLLLSVIGVFGVAAYAMAQRTREVGIRLALGATGQQIRAVIMVQGARPALIGLAVGLVGALAASRLLIGMLVGVSPLGLEAMVAVPMLLAGVSLLAAYLPARRAMAIDPVTVLKEE